LWRSRWNVDWQGKPKFSEKTCPSATFVHHKIPHDQTRFWTRVSAVGSRRLTAWAMVRPPNTFTDRRCATPSSSCRLAFRCCRNVLCAYANSILWKKIAVSLLTMNDVTKKVQNVIRKQTPSAVRRRRHASAIPVGWREGYVCRQV
jgi:hypothetical protein